VNAEHPVIYADRAARTPEGLALLVQLAETLQAAVCDSSNRLNFPWRHPLNQSRRQRAVLGEADVVLALEPGDPFTLFNQVPRGARKITISSVELAPKGNYQDLQRFASGVDLAIAADAEATLPSLIEEIRRQITPARKSAIDARGQRVAAAHKAAQLDGIRDARHGWDASPVSVPRLIAELGEQIAKDDWAIVSGHQFTGDWQRRLLNHDKPYRYNGDCGGFGIGYDTPASVGGALAHRKNGRLSVAIVGDGDLNFSPGVLWTAAHHKIPLLFIVHNNRAYHAEVMIIQRMCGVRGRGNENAHIGNVISNPDPNYAALAKAYGMYSEGPVDNPKDLVGAYQRALAKVRAGEPALIDVVSQPR
jgi:acetolactate synthase-1/2/3 large subunit